MTNYTNEQINHTKSVILTLFALVITIIFVANWMINAYGQEFDLGKMDPETQLFYLEEAAVGMEKHLVKICKEFPNATTQEIVDCIVYEGKPVPQSVLDSRK